MVFTFFPQLADLSAGVVSEDEITESYNGGRELFRAGFKVCLTARARTTNVRG